MQITQKHLTAFLHTCKGISILWVWNLVSYITGTTQVALTLSQLVKKFSKLYGTCKLITQLPLS